MAKLTTGVVRLSYANIAQPRKNDDGKAKYSSQIIIDKTDKKTIKAFERAIEELKVDDFDIEEEIYSGVYAQVALSVFAYNFNGKKGVGFGLNGIRKVKDGERLGGVHVSANDFGDDDLGDLDDDDDLI